MTLVNGGTLSRNGSPYNVTNNINSSTNIGANNNMNNDVDNNRQNNVNNNGNMNANVVNTNHPNVSLHAQFSSIASQMSKFYLQTLQTSKEQYQNGIADAFDLIRNFLQKKQSENIQNRQNLQNMAPLNNFHGTSQMNFQYISGEQRVFQNGSIHVDELLSFMDYEERKLRGETPSAPSTQNDNQFHEQVNNISNHHVRQQDSNQNKNHLNNHGQNLQNVIAKNHEQDNNNKVEDSDSKMQTSTEDDNHATFHSRDNTSNNNLSIANSMNTSLTMNNNLENQGNSPFNMINDYNKSFHFGQENCTERSPFTFPLDKRPSPFAEIDFTFQFTEEMFHPTSLPGSRRSRPSFHRSFNPFCNLDSNPINGKRTFESTLSKNNTWDQFEPNLKRLRLSESNSEIDHNHV